jgi:hypothetical protein
MAGDALSVLPRVRSMLMLICLGCLIASACGARWIPIQAGFRALESATINTWSQFKAPDYELIILGDAGAAAPLLSFLTLRTSKYSY